MQIFGLGFISFVIFQTILHEIGHTLGLNHSLVPGSIMSKAHPVKQLSITPSKNLVLDARFLRRISFSFSLPSLQ